MSGGVGTASAFGPIFENMGAPDATTVGVAAGTMGNIMGSLIGGPVAAFLISRHGLKSDPNDRPESAKAGSAAVLNNTRMIKAFALSLLVAALGMPIYCLLDNIPMIEMSKFTGRERPRKSAPRIRSTRSSRRS
jgi:ESS family glutamate:Na+ symporter